MPVEPAGISTRLVRLRVPAPEPRGAGSAGAGVAGVGWRPRAAAGARGQRRLDLRRLHHLVRIRAGTSCVRTTALELILHASKRRRRAIARAQQLHHVPAVLRLHGRGSDLAVLEQSPRRRRNSCCPWRRAGTSRGRRLCCAVALSAENRLASVAKSRAALELVDDLLRGVLAAHQDVARVILDQRRGRRAAFRIPRAVSASVGSRSFRYFCAAACCSRLSRVQLEARGHLGLLGEAVLLGLLRDQLDADQVLP